MKPVEFENANAKLHAPGCGDLPVIQTRDNCLVSCWEMSEQERKEFEKTGQIWLTIIGLKHPPVCMSVEKPFAMVKDGKEEEE